MERWYILDGRHRPDHPQHGLQDLFRLCLLVLRQGEFQQLACLGGTGLLPMTSAKWARVFSDL